MDLKMINLAIGKLYDDSEKQNLRIKELEIQVSVLKLRKPESAQEPLQNTQQDDEFLTMTEVRKLLKVSRNNILRMISNGDLKEIRLSKRTIRYSKSGILELMKGRIST